MIRKVSIPLVVGMIVAAGVGPSDILAAVSLAAASATLSFYALRPGRPEAVPIALCFLLGVFCRSSCSLLSAMPWHLAPSTGRLESLIDSVQFSGGQTSALLKALIAGRRDLLPPQIVESFRQAGASHILALSGLHLGVIYGFVARILSVLGNSIPARRARCAVTVSFSAAYAVITGAGPSITRAFLFILLNEIGRLHPERRRDGLSVFWAALTIQLVLDPMVLDSVGFQLSYLAMLGIFTIYPVLRNWYPVGSGLLRLVWNSAALSFSCQLFTAPLVLLRFGTFPKYFLLTNLIAMPLTTLLVTSSLCCMILTPPGLCPAVLREFVDILSEVLTSSLGIIGGM